MKRSTKIGAEASNRLYCFMIGLDVFANAIVSLLIGGYAYQTISCRIGIAMGIDGSWAANWTWPAWWRQHCMNAVFELKFAADQVAAQTTARA